MERPGRQLQHRRRAGPPRRAAGDRARRALPALALAALAALGVATFRQVRTWRDTETLFEHALRVTEGNAVAHVNLGLAVARAGRLLTN